MGCWMLMSTLTRLSLSSTCCGLLLPTHPTRYPPPPFSAPPPPSGSLPRCFTSIISGFVSQLLLLILHPRYILSCKGRGQALVLWCWFFFSFFLSMITCIAGVGVSDAVPKGPSPPLPSPSPAFPTSNQTPVCPVPEGFCEPWTYDSSPSVGIGAGGSIPSPSSIPYESAGNPRGAQAPAHLRAASGGRVTCQGQGRM